MFKTKSEEPTLSVNQQIGSVLRDERIAQGLSSAEIAKDCKLQEVFVRAIEEGHTDYLPSNIYFRMFARLYADTLDINPDQLLGKLYPELPSPEKPEFAGAAYQAQARNAAQTTDNPQSNTTIGGHALVQPAGAMQGQSNFDMSGLTSQTGTLTANRKKLMTRAGLGLAAIMALFFIAKHTFLNNGFAGENSNPAGQTTEDISTGDSQSESTIPAYQPREQLELTIKAKPSAKSSVVVVIADGDTLFNREMRGGEVYTWSSNYRFKLDIADKDQFEIFIGGQRLQTPDGSSKRVAGLEITQLNYEELLAPLSAASPTETSTQKSTK